MSIGSESSVCLGCQYVKCLFTADEAVNLVQYEPTSQRSSLLSIDSDTEEALRISSMSVSAAVFLLASISLSDIVGLEHSENKLLYDV